MQFVIYKRVPTKGQGKSGLGLEALNRDIRLFLSRYAEAAEIVSELNDVLSGRSADTPF